MILPDVNVLLYAFRRDSMQHDRYREWVDGMVNGRSPYGMSPQVLCSLIRISTHSRIYRQPSRLAEALDFCRALMEPRHCVPVLPGPRHYGLFEVLCREASANGNLAQDAWFAALAVESGCEWITTDRDYARFRELRWRTPFASA